VLHHMRNKPSVGVAGRDATGFYALRVNCATDLEKSGFALDSLLEEAVRSEPVSDGRMPSDDGSSRSIQDNSKAVIS
jgi:hypothetical protein